MILQPRRPEKRLPRLALVVGGVLTTDSMISGPVVNSCANGLFTWAMTSIIELWWNYVDVEGSDVSVLVKYDCIRYFAL